MNNTLKQLVEESDPLIGKEFIDNNNKRYKFIGILVDKDDYYYVMYPSGGLGLKLLSCVGTLESHGFKLLEGK